jgi:membrane protein implicated in regulation of membrane protease activity
MTGGQIAALVCALLLLLPGGCFLLFGIGFATDSNPQFSDAAPLLLGVAAAILALAGLLFWLALRRRSGRGGSSGEAGT